MYFSDFSSGTLRKLEIRRDVNFKANIALGYKNTAIDTNCPYKKPVL